MGVDNFTKTELKLFSESETLGGLFENAINAQTFAYIETINDGKAYELAESLIEWSQDNYRSTIKILEKSTDPIDIEHRENLKAIVEARDSDSKYLNNLAYDLGAIAVENPMLLKELTERVLEDSLFLIKKNRELPYSEASRDLNIPEWVTNALEEKDISVSHRNDFAMNTEASTVNPQEIAELSQNADTKISASLS